MITCMLVVALCSLPWRLEAYHLLEPLPSPRSARTGSGRLRNIRSRSFDPVGPRGPGTCKRKIGSTKVLIRWDHAVQEPAREKPVLQKFWSGGTTRSRNLQAKNRFYKSSDPVGPRGPGTCTQKPVLQKFWSGVTTWSRNLQAKNRFYKSFDPVRPCGPGTCSKKPFLQKFYPVWPRGRGTCKLKTGSTKVLIRWDHAVQEPAAKNRFYKSFIRCDHVVQEPAS